jgi:hypothetical protein
MGPASLGLLIEVLNDHGLSLAHEQRNSPNDPPVRGTNQIGCGSLKDRSDLLAETYIRLPDRRLVPVAPVSSRHPVNATLHDRVT